MQTLKALPTLTLLLLISFGSISAVLFTPGLPVIAAYFHVSQSIAQLAITLYLIGYALGQLIYGPLSNRFGRKPAIYIGVIVQIIASLLCAISAPLHSITLLLVARFLMALGASAGVTMTFTLVADVYHQHQAAKVVSYLVLAFAIMPGVGTGIGGLLVQHFNWQSCFYFLAFYGVCLALLTRRMPETASKLDKHAIKLPNIICNYFKQAREPRLIYAAIIMGLNTTYIYLFASLAPFLAISILHITPAQYGMWNIVPALGILLGALVAAQLSERCSAHTIIFAGLVLTLLSIITMIFLLESYPTALSLFASALAVYFSLTLILPNVSTLATKHSTDKSNASAMTNFINLSVSGIIVTVAEMFSVHSLFVLPLLYLALIVMQMACFLMLDHHCMCTLIKKAKKEQAVMNVSLTFNPKAQNCKTYSNIS